MKNKTINKLIKYSIPKNFQIKSLCKNKVNCDLTKKELCESISENLIIKNNIIAAILTTIPYKNKNGEYEGGVCYKKFLNLYLCKVCLPDNFRTLISNENINIKKMIPDILKMVNYLDKDSCKKNDGFFYELTNYQREILSKKIKDISSKEFKENPNIKYNIYFEQFTAKLKNTYFENLNYLIDILELLKTKLIFSNKILNEISNKTKKIIDDIYNMCNYYYIYGIISLIKLDIKENEEKKPNKINLEIQNALRKNYYKVE